MLMEAIDGSPDPVATERRYADATSVGRIFEPGEIAEIVEWISDRRPFALSSAALPLDGGKSSVLPLPRTQT
jgi:hypothetical protein